MSYLNELAEKILDESLSKFWDHVGIMCMEQDPTLTDTEYESILNKIEVNLKKSL